MPTTGEGDGAASNGSSFTHAQWPAPQHGIQSLPPKEKQKARDAAANPGVYEQAMRPQEHSGPQGNNGQASKYMRLRTTAVADGSHAEQAVWVMMMIVYWYLFSNHLWLGRRIVGQERQKRGQCVPAAALPPRR